MGVLCSVLSSRIYLDHVYGEMAEKKDALFIACMWKRKGKVTLIRMYKSKSTSSVDGWMDRHTHR